MWDYVCDPTTGNCSGGFGGGNVSGLVFGNDGGGGYSFGVSGVPYFGGSSYGSSDIFGPLIQTGVNTGLSYLGQRQQQRQQNQQRDAQIEQAWEEIIQQVLALYRSIGAKPATSAADIEQALAAFSALESFVSQANNAYITEQWNSSAYRPAFQSQLAGFQVKLGVGSAGILPASDQGGLFGGVSGGGIDITLILIALVAVVALKN